MSFSFFIAINILELIPYFVPKSIIRHFLTHISSASMREFIVFLISEFTAFALPFLLLAITGLFIKKGK